MPAWEEIARQAWEEWDPRKFAKGYAATSRELIWWTSEGSELISEEQLSQIDHLQGLVRRAIDMYPDEIRSVQAGLFALAGFGVREARDEGNTDIEAMSSMTALVIAVYLAGREDATAVS